MQTINLSKRNRDYAIFLPSISGFYNTFVSKQRYGEYVPHDRIPADFEHGIEGCNFLNKEKGYFTYDHALYSAGHAQLDIDKSTIQESMVQERDRENTWILGDSGGFQIGKGVINFDWPHFWEKKGDPGYVGSADKVRLAILNWLEYTADYSMILDIPAWAADPVNRDRTGLTSFKDCLEGTIHNCDFFLKNRLGVTKFLNVLQGGNNTEADIWYDAVKHYPFEGWAMGGNNMRDVDLVLRRLIKLRDDKLLEPGRDVIHYLGTSKLEWAVILTSIQRNLRETVNKDIKVTFDCASPFIATAHGQVYTQHVHRNDRFSYIMDKAVDSKTLAGSDIPFPWTSPIAERMTMGDICYYKPGDLNKLGKEGKTSWDSFSYFLYMAHNVYQHMESVQRANALADAACVIHKPNINEWRKIKNKSAEGQFDVWTPRDVVYMVELINNVFKSETPFDLLDKAEGLLANFNEKKTLKTSASTFNSLFDLDEVTHSSDSETFDGIHEGEDRAMDKALEKLEEDINGI